MTSYFCSILLVHGRNQRAPFFTISGWRVPYPQRRYLFYNESKVVWIEALMDLKVPDLVPSWFFYLHHWNGSSHPPYPSTVVNFSLFSSMLPFAIVDIIKSSCVWLATQCCHYKSRTFTMYFRDTFRKPSIFFISLIVEFTFLADLNTGKASGSEYMHLNA